MCRYSSQLEVGMEEDKVFKVSNKSSLVIHNGRIYIRDRESKVNVVTVTPGFQISFGYNIEIIIQALKLTRLPIMVKLITDMNGVQQYQIVRMHTGKVDDKVIATVACAGNCIKAVSFNKALLHDDEYKRYNRLSLIHQVSLQYNLAKTTYSCRKSQVITVFYTVLGLKGLEENIEVHEEGARLEVFIHNIRYKFVKTVDRFEMLSITKM